MTNSQEELRVIHKKKEKKRPRITHHVREASDLQVSPLIRENDRIVLEALRRVAHATRSQLVRLCGLPRTTIYDALVRLERVGAVDRYFEARKKRGRPKTLYRIT